MRTVSGTVSEHPLVEMLTGASGGQEEKRFFIESLTPPKSSMIRSPTKARPGAVKKGRGAFARLFPELEGLSHEQVSEAIEESR